MVESKLAVRQGKLGCKSSYSNMHAKLTRPRSATIAQESCIAAGSGSNSGATDEAAANAKGNGPNAPGSQLSGNPTQGRPFIMYEALVRNLSGNLNIGH